MELEILLQKYFKSHSFRSTQKEVIETVLGGDDVFVRLRDIFNDYISMNMDSLMQKYNSKIQRN